MSLSALQKLIRDSLITAMPGSYWVTAEIAELKENYSGHCYLELVEKAPDSNALKARARATIWAARYHILKSIFENATGNPLAAGMNVLLKVSVEYHEIYGLSLNVSDIDPAYTIGEMALRRNEIIKRLRQEGVWDMNTLLPFPPLPQRIAVISSESAAGYTDFIRHLTDNEFGYQFVTELFPSPMQGGETEKGVIAALDRIVLRSDDFDLAVILRGGGSIADLQWFDNYLIAFHVAQFPLPVLTGIGHEKDISVTDMVAWRSFKTPTAVAAFITDRMRETEEVISDSMEHLRDLSTNLLLKNQSLTLENARRILPASSGLIKDTGKKINAAGMALSGLASVHIRNAVISSAIIMTSLKTMLKQIIRENGAAISAGRERLRTESSDMLIRKHEEISIFNEMIKISDPENILKKGFTITRFNGQAVRTSSDLKTGDIITTHFHDGSTDSIINRVKLKNRMR